MKQRILICMKEEARIGNGARVCPSIMVLSRRKQKAKAPNPLAVKKKQKKAPKEAPGCPKASQDNQPAKRKRIRKSRTQGVENA